MDLERIFTYILSHPQNYPGKHQASQPRTDPSHKPLEQKAQFHIIFRALSAYIREKMIDGKVKCLKQGVNIKNFGAFTFEVFSDVVKPIQFSQFNTSQTLEEQRQQRQHIHKIRPCFVADTQLKQQLTYYNNKEEISAPASQHSVYQKGFQMVFCNCLPIANACYLHKDVVNDALDAFIRCTIELIALHKDLSIDFGFCKLSLVHKSISYQYKREFSAVLNEINFESKMRKSETKTSQAWQDTYENKWNKSTLNTLLKKPDSTQVQGNNEKTLALKILSLDLNTIEPRR